MAFSVLFRFVFVVLLICSVAFSKDETEAEEYMEELDSRYTEECNAEMVARWDYITDVNNKTAEESANDASVVYFKFQSEAAKNVSQYDYPSFKDVNLYREFRFQADQGPGGLNETDLEEYQNLQSKMETIYGSAKICPYEDQNCKEPSLTLEPDIEEIMATSTDWEVLKYTWEEWRKQTGALMREDYLKFVSLSNTAAKNDGYSDTSEYWLNGYTVTDKEAKADIYKDPNRNMNLTAIDQETFKTQIEEVWQDVFESLYKPLHAYVRKRLMDKYPKQIASYSLLPANVLGDMWAQDWTNVAPYVMPFEDQPDFDVTQSMIDNGWNIDKMVDSAEDFFSSIDLFNMTQTFKEKSIFNQTEWGKEIICHASAEDFCLGPGSEDFRIKMCTDVNMVDLVTVHHEMGHIEYFMAYRENPHVFRDSANPGFHEAIGDLIALSVSTPKHMEDILGLEASVPSNVKFENGTYTPEEQMDLNFLMRMALEKVAFLPFGYLIDKYRWGIFDGSIKEDQLNSAWWDMREKYQGVIPPSYHSRGEEFFDPGAKYHVPANVPYIRYFVSFIVQFQFHQNLCQVIKHEGPLHTCDIYGHKDAGKVLRKALEMGLSQPWPVVLYDLGGSSKLDAGAIKEYFKPLMDYLKENLDPEEIGWTDNPSSLPLEEMESQLTPYAQEMVLTAWNYNINMTKETAAQMNDASVEFSGVYKRWWEELISVFPYEELEDESEQRQYAMQQSIGTSILDNDKLSELNTHLTAMMEFYGEKVCPFGVKASKCSDSDKYDIDRLEIEMAENTDYSELLYYWESWREVSGNQMIGDFNEYVRLMNEAAVANKFNDSSDMWIEPFTTYGLTDGGYNYTSDHFRDDIERLWLEVKGYYEKLHGYVRWRIEKDREEHGKYIYSDRLIPAHILGNMWAQSWENIYEYVAPYPDVDLIDISDDLENNDNVTVTDMFTIAEDFYKGIGMYAMNDDFWNNSVIEQPTDGTQMVCHASAWDFLSNETNNREDGKFRIKMCTNKNQEDFIVIHHEMGHIEYQMAYSENKSLIFRDGANPGFHEAIGDTIALSVSTPAHLEQIQKELNKTRGTDTKDAEIEEPTKQHKRDINFLMKQALSKFVFLPYSYIMDQWRWEVFQGKITPDVYNERWWEKRIDYQGLRPPISRTADTDFDIASKFHIPASSPYISYFVAHILQFQFHQKLCEVAGQTGELYQCDIAGSKKAGSHFLTMLEKGSSEHWQKQLSEFLESSEENMNSAAIINYFKPLWTFLDEEIQKNNITTTWASSAEVIDKYINEGDTISAIVPIIVGVVLAVLICIVLVAFFVGQKRRKKADKEAGEPEHLGKVNEALEMDQTNTKV